MTGALVLAFLRGHWKVLAQIGAVMVAALLVLAAIHKLERDAYKHGQADEAALVQKRIDTENARNRQTEQKLQTALTDYAAKVAKQQQELDAKASVQTTRIQTIVAHDPTQNCATNPDITKARNIIRGSLK